MQKEAERGQQEDGTVEDEDAADADHLQLLSLVADGSGAGLTGRAAVRGGPPPALLPHLQHSGLLQLQDSVDTRIDRRIHTRTHIHIHTHKHTRTYKHTHTHTYKHTHTHTNTHTHTHKHTHTHTHKTQTSVSVLRTRSGLIAVQSTLYIIYVPPQTYMVSLRKLCHSETICYCSLGNRFNLISDD